MLKLEWFYKSEIKFYVYGEQVFVIPWDRKYYMFENFKDSKIVRIHRNEVMEAGIGVGTFFDTGNKLLLEYEEPIYYA